MKQRIISYLKFRRIPLLLIPVLGIITALAVGSHVSYQHSMEQQLSVASGLHVEDDSLVSLASTKALQEATRYRHVVFLASKPGVPTRDLYLAQIKSAGKAKLLALRTVVNLTSSDAADDYQFAVLGQTIYVAARTESHITSIAAFNLGGWKIPKGEKWSSVQKVFARINDYQQAGLWKGVEKTIIRLKKPASKLYIEASGEPNTIVLSGQKMDGGNFTTRVNLQRKQIDKAMVSLVPHVRLPKKPILWMVDSVRSIPAIGPGPIEWAEGRVFALKDQLKQWKYALGGYDDSMDADHDSALAAADYKIELNLEPGKTIGDFETLEWPPRSLEPPVFSNRRQGEGAWTPANPEFMKHLPNAPPSVYKTHIRSDRERPYTHVKLFAIDTRQLSLHMVGGHEDPISTTGEVGTGKLPEDPEVRKNIAMVFNGAFKSIHGEWGMMADKTILLPPKTDGATVATTEDGSIGLGSWPKDAQIPPDMMSYRQNMDPLLEGDKVNPRRRYLWGFTLEEDISLMNTIRSGVCMRDDGILVYAWGDDLNATTLGIAMKAAECTYGVHLDMNPFHTSLIAFQFYPKPGMEELAYKHKKLIRNIRFWPERYIHGAPKDFFYMKLRRNVPPGEGWKSKHLTQPRPSFLPTVHVRQKTPDVRIAAIDQRAAQAYLLPGYNPSSQTDSEPEIPPLPQDDNLLVEFVLNQPATETGQLHDGQMVHQLVPGVPTLMTDADGQITIIPFDESMMTAQSDALQGRWLISGDKTTDTSSANENSDVAAVGIAQNGWIYLATGPAKQIASNFKDLSVQKAIVFANDDTSCKILVRTPTGMQQIDGVPSNTRDARRIGLRLSARQRTPYGKRLSQLF